VIIKKEITMDTYDLIVIGAGPGGYVGAIRAAQLGLGVACIEKDKTLGGTCLNVGCIPSKALLESSEKYTEAKLHLGAHGIEVGSVGLNLGKMLERKDKIVKQLTGGVAMLFRKNKIAELHGIGRFSGAREGDKHVIEIVADDGSVTSTIAATNVLIATGSKVASIPGVEFDHLDHPESRVGTSTEALIWPAVPKHLVVIGAGVIGLELGSVWARLGAEVTVLEYMPKLLPTMEPDVGQLALKLFEKQGLKFQFGVKVTGAVAAGEGAKVTYQAGDETKIIECERVLVAVGRKPMTDGLGLDKIGITPDRRGCLVVDEHFRTTVPGVWAIGDDARSPRRARRHLRGREHGWPGRTRQLRRDPQRHLHAPRDREPGQDHHRARGRGRPVSGRQVSADRQWSRQGARRNRWIREDHRACADGSDLGRFDHRRTGGRFDRGDCCRGGVLGVGGGSRAIDSCTSDHGRGGQGSRIGCFGSGD
jgi:pyruvate/2-oxoglutarate dehydrogenase complex dihydrolipoamide dehydrogenase (E3) component